MEDHVYAWVLFDWHIDPCICGILFQYICLIKLKSFPTPSQALCILGWNIAGTSTHLALVGLVRVDMAKNFLMNGYSEILIPSHKVFSWKAVHPTGGGSRARRLAARIIIWVEEGILYIFLNLSWSWRYNIGFYLGRPTFGAACGFIGVFLPGFFPPWSQDRYLGTRHVQSNGTCGMWVRCRRWRRRLRHFTRGDCFVSRPWCITFWLTWEVGGIEGSPKRSMRVEGHDYIGH